MKLFDCLVIGGGPAGLAAAVQLARLRRSCVLVDDDAGRSQWSQITRNHLGFPEGIRTADLRLLGQRQAVAYGARLLGGRVVRLRRARRPDGSFVARIEADVAPSDDETPGLAENRDRERAHGARLGERRTRGGYEVAARTVLLATGVVDRFPTFEGRDECIGVSLFWCIVCDGFESIGRHVTVVGDDREAIDTAFGLLHFTDRVTLVTGSRRTRAPAARLRELESRGVTVRRAAVAAYRHAGGRIERLDLAGERDGVGCEMVFVSTPKRPRIELARRLGARVDAGGYLEVDEAGRTSVTGLYGAGDILAGHPHQVTEAAATGAAAATAINYDLYDPVERGEG